MTSLSKPWAYATSRVFLGDIARAPSISVTLALFPTATESSQNNHIIAISFIRNQLCTKKNNVHIHNNWKRRQIILLVTSRVNKEGSGSIISL